MLATSSAKSKSKRNTQNKNAISTRPPNTPRAPLTVNTNVGAAASALSQQPTTPASASSLNTAHVSTVITSAATSPVTTSIENSAAASIAVTTASSPKPMQTSSSMNACPSVSIPIGTMENVNVNLSAKDSKDLKEGKDVQEAELSKKIRELKKSFPNNDEPPTDVLISITRSLFEMLREATQKGNLEFLLSKTDFNALSRSVSSKLEQMEAHAKMETDLETARKKVKETFKKADERHINLELLATNRALSDLLATQGFASHIRSGIKSDLQDITNKVTASLETERNLNLALARANLELQLATMAKMEKLVDRVDDNSKSTNENITIGREATYAEKAVGGIVFVATTVTYLIIGALSGNIDLSQPALLAPPLLVGSGAVAYAAYSRYRKRAAAKTHQQTASTSALASPASDLTHDKVKGIQTQPVNSANMAATAATAKSSASKYQVTAAPLPNTVVSIVTSEADAKEEMDGQRSPQSSNSEQKLARAVENLRMIIAKNSPPATPLEMSRVRPAESGNPMVIAGNTVNAAKQRLPLASPSSTTVRMSPVFSSTPAPVWLPSANATGTGSLSLNTSAAAVQSGASATVIGTPLASHSPDIRPQTASQSKSKTTINP